MHLRHQAGGRGDSRASGAEGAACLQGRLQKRTSKDDIAAVHRVGKVGRGPWPILVKCVSGRKRKKSLKGKDEYRKVNINDDLTPLPAKLLALVKVLDDVDKAWSVGRRIHCTKKVPPGPAPVTNQRPVVVIDAPDDLFKLGLEQTDFGFLGLTHMA